MWMFSETSCGWRECLMGDTWGTGPIRKAWLSLPRDLISAHHKNDSCTTDCWDLEHKDQQCSRRPWQQDLDVGIKSDWYLCSEDEPWGGCGSCSGLWAQTCTSGSLDKGSHCISGVILDPGSKQLRVSEAAICCCSFSPKAENLMSGWRARTAEISVNTTVRLQTKSRLYTRSLLHAVPLPENTHVQFGATLTDISSREELVLSIQVQMPKIRANVPGNDVRSRQR